MQLNSSTGELLFWNKEGKRQTPGSQRERKCDTHNCVLVWNTAAAQVQTAHIQVCSVSITMIGRWSLQVAISVTQGLGDIIIYDDTDSGKYLVALDRDAHSRMFLYDWENEVVRAATETDEWQTMEV